MKNMGLWFDSFYRPYMGSVESPCIKVIQQQQQQPGSLQTAHSNNKAKFLKSLPYNLLIVYLST